MEGVIKWFSEEKGYGFITAANNIDYYFHVSDIKGSLLPEKGQNAHFNAESTSKGHRAKTLLLQRVILHQIIVWIFAKTVIKKSFQE